MKLPKATLRNDIVEGVRVLNSGGVVVIPTDTLYGLAADVFSTPALERVFDIKRRPQGLPLPVLVSCWDQVTAVAPEFPKAARQLAERFWPGPLTLVLPKAPGISDILTGGRDTVGVRMPDHQVPLDLARELGRPITGSSANRSGAQDLTTLEEVEAELGTDVDYIIRSGPAPQGVPSTVVEFTGGVPRLVRQGVVPFADILAAST
jgi:L-threonylcarbamoyladenylate synthase